MYVFFSDYIRCGGESGQCIRIMDKCNGIEDCQNGWDEDIDTCVSPAEQAFFVERGSLGKYETHKTLRRDFHIYDFYV